MSAEQPPIGVGTITTTDDVDSDLGKLYQLGNAIYRFVKTSTAIITNAGGKVLVLGLTAGVPNWTVSETTTAGDQEVAGVVPTTGSIAATTTFAASTRFMIQVSGPCTVQAANTTVVNPAALITATTAGTVSSMTTGVEGAAAVTSFLGYATNTAAATAANGAITCVLRSLV
jgi:hypothetical protein